MDGDVRAGLRSERVSGTESQRHGVKRNAGGKKNAKRGAWRISRLT